MIRALHILSHFLFNWRIKPEWIDYPRWKAMTNSGTLATYPEYAPPRWLFWRQRWQWKMDGHDVRTFKRMQFVRSITDNRW